MKVTTGNERNGWKTTAMAVATVAVLLTMSGCGNMTEIPATAVNTYSNAAVISGTIHGGQQPVAYSTVKLYTIGTTGYGSAGTLLATTTTTSPDGGFSFTQSGTNGSSSGTTNVYSCPATTDDPQVYLIATGGNSQGTGLNDAADTNSAIALVAALGTCSKVSNQFVVIDEASTAAAAFALAPYINPGTTAGTETIGTNGANVPTSTPQGAIGLNNAVAAIANLKAAATTYTGTSSSTSAIQITATPEANKINTIADILASCVNTTTLPSANCTQLFNGAISTAGTKPVDIFQAAYYMATNPTDAGTFTSCGTPTTNLGCLYELASPTAPFQGTLATAPTDWTVGVTYTVSNSGTCSNNGFGGAGFFDTPTRVAVDAIGNIFVMNGSVSKAAIVEMSPVGVPLACVIPAVAAGTAETYGQNLTIDTSGNVWGSYGHATFANSVVEWPAGATTTTSYSPAAEVYGITTDLDGNVFYTTSVSGGTVYEFVAPTTGTLSLSTATSVTAFTSFLNGSTGTVQLNNMQTDTTGRIFGITPSSSNLLAAYPLTASITAYAVASDVATFTAANSFTAGQTVNISGLSTTNGTQFNGRLVLASANSTSFTANVTTANVSTTTDTGAVRATGAGAYTTANTGLTSASYGLAIGASNAVYTGTACCGNTLTAVGKAEHFTPAATAVAGAGASSAQYLGGMNGTRSTAVDGAGNVWLGEYWPETGSTYGLVELGSAGTGTTATFTAKSTSGTAPTAACSNTVGCPVAGGFQKTAFTAASDVAIDPSGNVWVLNTGTNTADVIGTNGTSITEVVGAATPVATPLSVAAKNGTLGTKP